MSQELTERQKFRLFHVSEMARVLRILKDRFGEEVYSLIAKHNGERAYKEWQEIGINCESNTINDLIKHLWEPLQKEGFEYEAVETESGVQMKCTRCASYDLAKHLGITEEAFYMFCECDPYITEGFNSNIGFKRTKTLMQGHDCCDHFYYIKDKNN